MDRRVFLTLLAASPSLAYALPKGGTLERFAQQYMSLDDSHIEVCRAVEFDNEEHIFIDAPRGWGKTRLISQIIPAWCLGFESDIKTILALSDTEFSGYQNKKHTPYVRQEHVDRIYRKGAQSAFTGLRPDLIIADDVVNEAMSHDQQKMLANQAAMRAFRPYTKIITVASYPYLNFEFYDIWVKILPPSRYITVG